MACSNDLGTYTRYNSLTIFSIDLIYRLHTDVDDYQIKITNSIDSYVNSTNDLCSAQTALAAEAIAVECLAHTSAYETRMLELKTLIEQFGELDLCLVSALFRQAPLFAGRSSEEVQRYICDQMEGLQDWFEYLAAAFSPENMKLLVQEQMSRIRDGDVVMMDVDDGDAFQDGNLEDEEEDSKSDHKSDWHRFDIFGDGVVWQAKRIMADGIEHVVFRRDEFYFFDCLGKRGLETEDLEFLDFEEIEERCDSP